MICVLKSEIHVYSSGICATHNSRRDIGDALERASEGCLGIIAQTSSDLGNRQTALPQQLAGKLHAQASEIACGTLAQYSAETRGENRSRLACHACKASQRPVVAGVSMHGCQCAADMGIADGCEPTCGRGSVAIDPTADEPGCQQIRHSRQDGGAAHLRLRGLRRHGRQQRTNDRVIAGHVATLDDSRHQRDQWIERTGVQGHGAAEKGACRARSFPHHFADIAP